MALDPSDRDLLRIYADPSISPEEKARMLGGGDPSGGIPMPQPLPPGVGGLPSGAVAGPGGGAGGTSGADDVGPGNAPAAAPVAAGAGGAPSVDTQAGATTGVTGGGTDTPVTGSTSEPTATDQQKYLAATLSPNDLAAEKAAHPELWGGAPGTPPGTSLASAGAPSGPGGPGDYRGALRLMNPAAGAVVPMEQVHQSTNVSQSSVDPGQIAALGEAKQRADADEMQKQIAEARIAQQSGNIQLSAEKQAQAEKTALEATRQQALARADQILAQQDKISQQIVNTGPVMPGLMSSDNWSDTLFTVLSVMGAGAGASSPEKAAEAVQRIANNEVQKQQAALDKNKGDLGTLNNLYSAHLENLKDHELAKQATIADIYGRAQAEIQSMIQENGQAPDSLVNRKLQAQASALGAQRAEYMADVQSKLGPKIEQQEAISFVRKHSAQPTAGMPAAAPGAVPVGSTPKGTGHAMPAPAGAPAVAAPRDAADAINHAAELWNKGNPREALALLPPTVRTAVLAQAQRSQKGLGEGATREDALAYALHDMSNGQFQIPKEFIPQSAREKLVQIPGGAQGFATGKAQADELQKDFNNDSALIGAYQQLMSLANQPASAWTPDMRARIDSITSLIRPMTAHALGQRGMSSQEQELFDGISGHDINSVKDFLLGTGKASAEQALQIARSRVRARARSLSRDPFDFIPIEDK